MVRFTKRRPAKADRGWTADRWERSAVEALGYALLRPQ